MYRRRRRRNPLWRDARGRYTSHASRKRLQHIPGGGWNPRRRHYRRYRRYRRNPMAIRGITRQIATTAIPLAVGMIGSKVAVDMLPIPVKFKTGVLRYVSIAGLGVALGYLVGKVFKKPAFGNLVAVGGLTLAAHDVLTDYVLPLIRRPALPAPTTGMGTFLPRYSMGAYMPPSRQMGAYHGQPFHLTEPEYAVP